MAYSPKPDKRNTNNGMTPNKSIRRPVPQKPTVVRRPQGK